MCDIVVKKFTFAISSLDEFLYTLGGSIFCTLLYSSCALCGIIMLKVLLRNTDTILNLIWQLT